MGAAVFFLILPGLPPSKQLQSLFENLFGEMAEGKVHKSISVILVCFILLDGELLTGGFEQDIRIEFLTL